MAVRYGSERLSGPHHQMSRPLVTIVIPCFNAEGTVAAAISSALRQSYEAIEIVVVDDGSTDGSLNIVRSYGRAVRCHSGPNRGGAAARNTGVAAARGEFVQFLDADDELDSRCVEEKLEAHQLQPDVSPCCDWLRHGLDGVVSPQRPHIKGDPVVAVVEGQILISSPLHRRVDLLNVGGFDPDLPCGQEKDLHLRLACAGIRFDRVPKALFTVRRRRGSVSDDYTKVLLNHLPIYSNAAIRLAETSQLTPDRRFAIARALASDGRRLYHKGLVPEAQAFWSRASELDERGIPAAYGRWLTRTVAGVIGPRATDGSVWLARALAERARI
jgi:glycosyltransferase involved in cell wall biosynthesis